MNTFRAFILDSAGRIIQSEILVASTSEEALEAAIPLAADNDLEVWQNDRRLAVIHKGGTVDPVVRLEPDTPKK